jgi:DNA-directed RNA polymerase I and III subunit RPAC1
MTESDRHVGITIDSVSHVRSTLLLLRRSDLKQVSSTDYPGHRLGEDSAWDLDRFTENLKVEIIDSNELEMEFDLVGVDASIANAFRRILIAEVPTMAIETVFVFNNTSVIQDEVLSHRLGLIPIKANPEKFGWQNSMIPGHAILIRNRGR